MPDIKMTDDQYREREAKMDEAMSLETSVDRLHVLAQDSSLAVRETAQLNLAVHEETIRHRKATSALEAALYAAADRIIGVSPTKEDFDA